MSTNRCLSTRCSQLSPCARTATTSTRPSGAAGTAPESSTPSGREAACVAIDRDRAAIAAGRARFASERAPYACAWSLRRPCGAAARGAAAVRPVRRHPLRLRRFLAPARRSGARLQLPPGRPARHAHGPAARRARQRLAGAGHVRGNARRDRDARGGALCAPHRRRHRARARSAAADAHARSSPSSSQRAVPHARARQAPGDAHLPGAAHVRQRRARPAAARARRRRSSCSRRAAAWP